MTMPDSRAGCIGQMRSVSQASAVDAWFAWALGLRELLVMHLPDDESGSRPEIVTLGGDASTTKLKNKAAEQKDEPG